MVFLMDPAARPSPHDMKLWVDAVRFVKRGAAKGALGFFTYMELSACRSFPVSTHLRFLLTGHAAIWLLLFHVFRPDRLKWYVVLYGLRWVSADEVQDVLHP